MLLILTGLHQVLILAKVPPFPMPCHIFMAMWLRCGLAQYYVFVMMSSLQTSRNVKVVLNLALFLGVVVVQIIAGK